MKSSYDGPSNHARTTRYKFRSVRMLTMDFWMDFFTTRSAFDLMCLFAIFAALCHLVVMKFPQQADSALQIIPSSAFALSGFALLLHWRAVSFAEAVALYLLFIALFVSPSHHPLLTTVSLGHRPADPIQCIFPTSRDSRVVLVYGDRYHVCQEYLHLERLFQGQWSSETAGTA
jgi:hypothetical protein